MEGEEFISENTIEVGATAEGALVTITTPISPTKHSRYKKYRQLVNRSKQKLFHGAYHDERFFKSKTRLQNKKYYFHCYWDKFYFTSCELCITENAAARFSTCCRPYDLAHFPVTTFQSS